MTSTALQHRSSTHLTNDTAATTQHFSKTDKATEADSTSTRSKPSHLCITIRGCGPASGRPGSALPAPGPRHDPIFSSSGWCWC